MLVESFGFSISLPVVNNIFRKDNRVTYNVKETALNSHNKTNEMTLFLRKLRFVAHSNIGFIFNISPYIISHLIANTDYIV